MAEDKLARLRREWSEENEEIRLLLRAHMMETDRRFVDVGRQIAAMGNDFGRRLKNLADEMTRLGQQIGLGFTEFGERLALESANNEERYNQLFGRMRLQEGRFGVFLGASETQWANLEQRVSEIERRLGPPAA